MKQRLIFPLFIFIYLLKHTHEKETKRVKLKDQYKYIFIIDGSKKRKKKEVERVEGRTIIKTHGNLLNHILIFLLSIVVLETNSTSQFYLFSY